MRIPSVRTMTRLVVEGLAFTYRSNSADRPVFDDWSHPFAPGLTWVRGDNGSGKSTLLALIGGALAPRAGRIAFGDVDVQADPVAYRRHVGWCVVDDLAFDHLKPFAFFDVVAERHPTFDRDLATSLVDALGLAPFVERQIHQLSTGSRRKVAVIATMAAGTDVVLLDEPLAALDRVSAASVEAHLAAAAQQRERTWIVTSHEPLIDAAADAHVVRLAARD